MATKTGSITIVDFNDAPILQPELKVTSGVATQVYNTDSGEFMAGADYTSAALEMVPTLFLFAATTAEVCADSNYMVSVAYSLSLSGAAYTEINVGETITDGRFEFLGTAPNKQRSGIRLNQNILGVVNGSGTIKAEISYLDNKTGLTAVYTGYVKLEVRATGEGTSILVLSTDNGSVFKNTIRNTTQSTTISSTYYKGASLISNGVIYKWYKDGTEVAGATSSSYTVNASEVGSKAVYACRATYDGTDAVAEKTIVDMTDPVSVELTADTGQDVPEGTTKVITANVYQNGKLIAFSGNYNWSLIGPDGVAVGHSGSGNTMTLTADEIDLKVTVECKITYNEIEATGVLELMSIPDEIEIPAEYTADSVIDIRRIGTMANYRPGSLLIVKTANDLPTGYGVGVKMLLMFDSKPLVKNKIYESRHASVLFYPEDWYRVKNAKLSIDTIYAEGAFLRKVQDGAIEISETEIANPTPYDVWLVPQSDVKIGYYESSDLEMAGIHQSVSVTEDGVNKEVIPKYWDPITENWEFATATMVGSIKTILANLSTKALADGKATVFTGVPYPPYGVGDLLIPHEDTSIDGKVYYKNEVYKVISVDGDTAVWGTVDNYRRAVDSINAFVNNVAAQTDKKVNTTVSSSAPTNPDAGDYWYDSMAKKVKKYVGNRWETTTEVNSSLFDFTDGKRTIHYLVTPPTTGVQVGDMNVNPTTKIVTMWDGSTWVDTTNVVANQAHAVANQAHGWAGAASKLITDPNTGAVTGWGFADGSAVQSEFKINSDKFTLEDSSNTAVPFLEVDNVAHTAKFNGVVQFGNVNGTPTHASGTTSPTLGATTAVEGSTYYNTSTKSGYIVSGGSWVNNSSVTDTSNLALNDMSNVTTIDGRKITAGTIDAVQLNTGSVTSDKIAANAITADKILANEIDATKIKLDGVYLSNNGGGTVTIPNNSITKTYSGSVSLTYSSTSPQTGNIITGIPISSDYKISAAVRLSAIADNSAANNHVKIEVTLNNVSKILDSWYGSDNTGDSTHKMNDTIVYNFSNLAAGTYDLTYSVTIDGDYQKNHAYIDAVILVSKR